MLQLLAMLRAPGRLARAEPAQMRVGVVDPAPIEKRLDAFVETVGGSDTPPTRGRLGDACTGWSTVGLFSSVLDGAKASPELGAERSEAPLDERDGTVQALRGETGDLEDLSAHGEGAEGGGVTALEPASFVQGHQPAFHDERARGGATDA